MNNIFIKIDETGKVTHTHYMPFDPIYGFQKSREELEQEGYFVANIPTPDVADNKIPMLYYNPEQNEFWYEYSDAPLTLEQEIERLKELVADLTSIVLEV